MMRVFRVEFRYASIQRFEGHCGVAASVNILLEGYDYPPLRTVMLRDSSRLPAIQMAGRALRLWDGKEIANIVQSAKTRWNVMRASHPRHAYLWKDGWTRLGDDKKVVDAVNATLKRLENAVIAPLPKYFGEKKRARWRQQ